MRRSHASLPVTTGMVARPRRRPTTPALPRLSRRGCEGPDPQNRRQIQECQAERRPDPDGADVEGLAGGLVDDDGTDHAVRSPGPSAPPVARRPRRPTASPSPTATSPPGRPRTSRPLSVSRYSYRGGCSSYATLRTIPSATSRSSRWARTRAGCRADAWISSKRRSPKNRSRSTSGVHQSPIRSAVRAIGHGQSSNRVRLIRSPATWVAHPRQSRVCDPRTGGSFGTDERRDAGADVLVVRRAARASRGPSRR